MQPSKRQRIVTGSVTDEDESFKEEMQPSKRQRIVTGSVTDEDESFKEGDYQLRDWREDQNLFRIRAKHAMEKGILTDINFTVGPQKTPFAAHKMILGLASPVFEAMFFGSLKESNNTIHIPDIMPCGFKQLLEFVYSDSIHFTDETEAFSAWFAAEKYCMPHMKSLCFEYLSTYPLRSSNVWTVLHNALFFNLQVIIDRCGQYLRDHTSKATKSPHFVEASKECIDYFIKLDNLKMKEVELLKSLVKWGKEREGADESIQQILQPFMKHIRFTCMTQQELVSFVDLHKNIISDEDVNKLLNCLSANETFSIPEWCCVHLSPRNRKYDNVNSKIMSNYFKTVYQSQCENGSFLRDEQGT